MITNQQLPTALRGSEIKPKSTWEDLSTVAARAAAGVMAMAHLVSAPRAEAAPVTLFSSMGSTNGPVLANIAKDVPAANAGWGGPGGDIWSVWVERPTLPADVNRARLLEFQQVIRVDAINGAVPDLDDWKFVVWKQPHSALITQGPRDTQALVARVGVNESVSGVTLKAETLSSSHNSAIAFYNLRFSFDERHVLNRDDVLYITFLWAGSGFLTDTRPVVPFVFGISENLNSVVVAGDGSGAKGVATVWTVTDGKAASTMSSLVVDPSPSIQELRHLPALTVKRADRFSDPAPQSSNIEPNPRDTLLITMPIPEELKPWVERGLTLQLVSRNELTRHVEVRRETNVSPGADRVTFSIEPGATTPSEFFQMRTKP